MVPLNLSISVKKCMHFNGSYKNCMIRSAKKDAKKNRKPIEENVIKKDSNL